MLRSEPERFARESIWAGSFISADREPAALPPEGGMTMPEDLNRALEAFYDAGRRLLPCPPTSAGTTHRPRSAGRAPNCWPAGTPPRACSPPAR